MSQVFANNASTTLSGAITNTATSLVVSSAANFPVLTSPDTFYMTLADPAEDTWEIVKVTATVGTTFTVARGQDGTTALAWATGSTVEMRPVAQSLRDMVAQPAGQLVYGDSEGKGLISSALATIAAGVITLVGVVAGASGVTSSGPVAVTNATASTSTTTGAMTVAGGVGVAGSVYAKGVVAVTPNAVAFLTSTRSDLSSSVTFIQSAATQVNCSGIFGTPQISITGPGAANVPGSLYYNSGWGLVFQGKTGSQYDFTITNPSQGVILGVTTTTSNIVFGGATTQSGASIVTATTASTSTTTGALIISGGAGIAGALNVGSGILATTGTFSAPSNVLLSVNNTIGGSSNVEISFQSAGIYKYAIGHNITIASCAAFEIYDSVGSKSLMQLYASSGAVNFLGSVNGPSATFSGNITASTGTFSASTASTTTTTGAVTVAGGVGIVGALYVGGQTNFSAAIASTGRGSGAVLISAGGLGVYGSISIGNPVTASVSAVVTSKVAIVVGSTTLYLLASTSAA